MKFLDLQDWLALIGVAAIIAGLWMWNRPAAIVAFGVVCLAVARRVEREAALRGPKIRRES